jgi:HPt (histidine-containing phosphotransfer) domain-containing protein
MTLQECYDAMGGNFQDVLGRLRSERMVQKFTLKFLDDPSYDTLVQAMGTGDYETAFRAVHTLKGVCQNLSFTRLGASSHALCEALRHGYTPEADELARQVTKDYEVTADAIRTFQSEAR